MPACLGIAERGIVGSSSPLHLLRWCCAESVHASIGCGPAAADGRTVSMHAQHVESRVTWLCRVPASETPEVFAVQQTMLEAWHIIAESFEDPTFGGLSWEVRAISQEESNCLPGCACPIPLSRGRRLTRGREGGGGGDGFQPWQAGRPT